MKRLLPLVLLLAACGGNPRPRPPAPPAPAPVATPTPAPGPPATPRPPKPEPTKEPVPIPPEVPADPDRLTICHAFDRTEEGDRVWLELTLPRERAEWHLQAHKSKEPGKGDYAGPCKAKES